MKNVSQDIPLQLEGAGGGPALVRHQPGTGPALVLIPGCGRDHHAFDALLSCLPGREVVVVCLPGRAGLPGPAPASAGDAAAFVLRVLRDLGVDRAVVGGHSYGGAVAIEIALSAPEVVAGLVLLSSGARLRAHPEILRAAEAAANADPATLANLQDWQACDAFDRLKDVARIAVPTLAVVGTEDVFTPPRYSRYLGDQIAGCRLVVIDGADHEAPTSHAARIASAILELYP